MADLVWDTKTNVKLLDMESLIIFSLLCKNWISKTSLLSLTRVTSKIKKNEKSPNEVDGTYAIGKAWLFTQNLAFMESSNNKGLLPSDCQLNYEIPFFQWDSKNYTVNK